MRSQILSLSISSKWWASRQTKYFSALYPELILVSDVRSGMESYWGMYWRPLCYSLSIHKIYICWVVFLFWWNVFWSWQKKLRLWLTVIHLAHPSHWFYWPQVSKVWSHRELYQYRSHWNYSWSISFYLLQYYWCSILYARKNNLANLRSCFLMVPKIHLDEIEIVVNMLIVNT